MASDDAASRIYQTLIGGLGSDVLDNATGTCSPDGCPIKNTTYIYDIATKAWEFGPETQVDHTDTCAVAADGRVWVILMLLVTLCNRL